MKAKAAVAWQSYDTTTFKGSGQSLSLLILQDYGRSNHFIASFIGEHVAHPAAVVKS